MGFENYNVVAPPPTGLFAPPTIDLSSSSLKEFHQPEFEGYGVNVNKSVSENSSNEIKKTTGALIIEDWVTDYDEDESEVMGDPQVSLKDTWIFDSGCSRHMTGNKSYLTDYQVGDEVVHKELGDRMERAATTASSLEAKQDSDAQTRFEAASKSPMIHLSQELTHLDVGRIKFNLSFSNHMANLEFCDKHNMIAYLQKSEGSEGFHQIIDFLNASHIQYALIENPTIYVSFIKQFWRTATARTSATGEFSSNIATDIICLATIRTFNFSKFIFDAMVKNLDNPHKFLMYPRFIQICLNKQRRLLQPHTRTFPTPFLTQKVFSNMKRATKGYSGEDIPLFTSMITAPETSPSRITSSPSLSLQHTPFTAPSTSQPSNIHTTLVVEGRCFCP
ncbi:hypothetical protein Tco_0873879 [Tanacetum coccineum]|uniref:Retrovirus-related Pol polyprotein from transposon TNT 1-94-like beta-barrel domain-containing protein n=1 Tax=Tanacetum coccineum TaxID=301880 RepID=A0ABQ5BKU9_9ASTR